MLQLQIVSGKQAGFLWEARRFPIQVGRSPECDLQLEEEGVWPRHFRITADAANGFALTADSEAVVMLNQAPVASARLRNGDYITAGAVKLAFRLAPTRQSSLRLRESFVVGLIAAVCLGQVAIVLWLW